MQAFVLAMALYPDVQDNAHAELDAVVGRGRLPTIEDRTSLPYLNAVVKELLRWHIVAPLGVPHMTVEDDVYNEYQIPKGSMIIANLW